MSFDVRIPCPRNQSSSCYFSLPLLDDAISQHILELACQPFAMHLSAIRDVAPDRCFVDYGQYFIMKWDNLEELRVLGQGSFGRVIESRTRSSPDARSMAVKIMLLQGSDHASGTEPIEAFHQEVYIMSLLHHPNIVRLHGICLEPTALVMELLPGGDLYSQLLDTLSISAKIANLIKFATLKRDEYLMMQSMAAARPGVWFYQHRSRLPIDLQRELESACLSFFNQHPFDPNRTPFTLATIDAEFSDNAFDHSFLSELNVELIKTIPIDLQRQYEPSFEPNEAEYRELLQQIWQSIHNWKDIVVRRSIYECPAKYRTTLSLEGTILNLVQPQHHNSSSPSPLDGSTSNSQVHLPVDLLLSHIDLVTQFVTDEFQNGDLLKRRPSPIDNQTINRFRDNIEHLSQFHSEVIYPMSWPIRLKIATDIVQALHHLHSRNPPIIHRDLKSPNIFMTKTFDQVIQSSNPQEIFAAPLAKLADFGLSLSLIGVRDHLHVFQSETTLAAVNPIWAAPEIIRGDTYSRSADVYALGIVLWELLVREFPFAHQVQSDSAALQSAKSKDVRSLVLDGERPIIPSACTESVGYVKLIEWCWAESPSSRPTTSQIYQSLYACANDLAPELVPFLPEPKIFSVSKDQYGRSSPTSLQWQVASIASVQLVQAPTTPSPCYVQCAIFISSNLCWLGFENGMVAAYEGEQSVTTFCIPALRHPQLVTSMTHLTVGHESIWTGSQDGMLQVWHSSPLATSDIRELYQKGGWLELRRGKEKPIEVWTKLEHGHLRFFKDRIFGDELFQLLVSDIIAYDFIDHPVPTLVLQYQVRLSSNKTKTSSLQLQSTKTKSTANSLKTWYTHLCFINNTQHQSRSLLRLTSFQFRDAITCLHAIDGHVWCGTTDMVLRECHLVHTSESHGMTSEYLFQIKRQIAIGKSDTFFPGFGAISHMLRVSPTVVWFAIGNRLGVIDVSLELDPDRSRFLGFCDQVFHTENITACFDCQFGDNPGLICTVDCNGGVGFWKHDESSSFPLLIRTLDFSSATEDSFRSACKVSPTDLWLGTSSGDILTLDVRSEKASPRSIFESSVELRHRRAVTTITTVMVSESDTLFVLSGSYDQSIRIYSLTSGNLSQE